MPIRTKLTEALGIRIPVVQGGMQWVGVAELASAVSNAGGLGILTALTQPTPEDLRNEIRRCRTMTDKPFGVNITLLPAIVPPDYEAYARVCVEEGVKVVETAGNNPQTVINIVKQAPITVIHKCVTVRHAISAQKMGIDFASIDGFECAGHPGEDDIGGLVLLALAARRLSVPYIASGGIGDGRGLAAALALGAEGVNIGTRAMCTAESPIHENIKKAIVNSSERDTTLILRTLHNTSRTFKNSVSQEVVRIETRGNAKFEDVRHLVAGARGRQVYTKGDPEAGIWTAGQVIGLIDDYPSCKELLERFEREAEQVIEEMARRLVPITVRAQL